jgi:chromatin remodeling complex protein RSC6
LCGRTNKREIIADEKLQAAFGSKNKVSMFELNKHLVQHLKRRSRSSSCRKEATEIAGGNIH